MARRRQLSVLRPSLRRIVPGAGFSSNAVDILTRVPANGRLLCQSNARIIPTPQWLRRLFFAGDRFVAPVAGVDSSINAVDLFYLTRSKRQYRPSEPMAGDGDAGQ